ncbi:allergen sol i III [Danaus plexippus plexippus]|uniref:Allergen sol i III n=1 Tax=Danaus plexippus plexippus TaxID=278856 RepID=A0A212F3S5_DANPL|nr:allergen sol i III [Danaus plexippus plexippus]
MGPTCAGVENATMTEDNAALILDLINSIRSRAARGLAMGYEKELLPRAYGMYRVEWDPELATLAQVWANQCVLERDNCRATKNFPDPGQQASIARFVTDKWIPISKTKDKTYNESSGFNSHKVIRLVCNFSSRVYDDRGIYNVTAPTTSEFTPQCGCPPGYDEDSWCLCYKSEKNKKTNCKINNTKSLSLKKIRNQHTKSRQTQLNYNNNLYEKESTEKDKAEFPIFLRRRNKKKHHGNNNNDLQPKSSRKNEKRKKLNKKRKPKAKYNKKFIKTTLKDIDRDSNMSGSKDSDSKNKPVDIIVHIKMNE